MKNRLSKPSNISLVILMFFIGFGNLYGQNVTDTAYVGKILPQKLDDNSTIYYTLLGMTNSFFYVKSKAMADSIQKAKEQGIPIIFSYDEENNIKSIMYYPKQIREKYINRASKIKLPIKRLTSFVPVDSVDYFYRLFGEMSCEIIGCSESKPCITFQYKRNGCFARAHWMSKIIEEDYGYVTKKIFSFGNLQTLNSGKCDAACINWGWHVAVMVYTQQNRHKDSFVIDPALNTARLTVEEWKAKQTQKCKQSSPEICETDVVPSFTYSYDSSTDEYVYDDENYSQTRKFLKDFCGNCPKRK